MRDCPVYLEPIEHVYIHKETNQKFKSVTTVISLLEPEFQTNAISLAISLKKDEDKKERYRGLSQQEIIDLWVKENREANEYGTEIHEILERYLIGNKFYIPKSDYEREVILEFQEIDPIVSGKINPEMILFSERYSLAGTADVIEDCDEYFNVWDFKTNKKINFVSEFGHWLNKPVSHLSDCQYNVYALQMSIYAYMYQMETRKKVGRLALLYLNPNTRKFEVIPVPYMGLEAKTVLSWYNENYNK